METISVSVTGRKLSAIAFGTILGYIHCPNCIDEDTEYVPYLEGNSALENESCDRCGEELL